jgi:hypothetical protein
MVDTNDRHIRRRKISEILDQTNLAGHYILFFFQVYNSHIVPASPT